MMKHSKIINLGCAFSMSVVSLSTFAASEQAGLEACVDALSAQLAAKNAVVADYHLSSESLNPDARLGGRVVFHLDARKAASRDVVARADCIVNRRAEVQQLNALPLSADDAAKRAKSL
jgi:hypothetical protein